MVTILVAAALALQVEEPPRLRTELPNGSVLLVERFAEAKSISVQLFANARGVEDTPKTHGYRHLLEHLVAQGNSADLDMRLESQGMFLRADTTRDYIHIVVTGPTNRLSAALDAVKEILSSGKWSKEQVATEAKAVAQELALLPDSAKFSSAMWLGAFGDAGLDPLGNAYIVAQATPDALGALYKANFAAYNLVLVVGGPFSVVDTTKQLKPMMAGLPDVGKRPLGLRREGKPCRVDVPDAFGEARAAIVPGIGDPKTAHVLAAAMALSTLVAHAYVTYTPSTSAGLVIVGQTDDNGGFGLKIDAMTPGERASLYEVGRNVALSWVARQMAGPRASGWLRGGLLVQGIDARPEGLAENLQTMTLDDFLAAVAAFDKDRAVVGAGVER